ncbi:hypothetical protein HETIRDRAFT_423103 [Heterobasidion irregulare TC 32-1]|uniref:Uncharacterized protein n=1 Tax=Heterobasidion irregulare (strain TC 32-1) TaxID=747525 RepID=W4JRB2_HETIT|nr:uncharacterized protein HETIRDRAFT_423103 [Heterobasidion irregulare TC 32-1]ETW75406.1 hypothetical protein HETIRDRAFT_423103 [Heterobasidion irregulare TC 32-1]
MGRHCCTVREKCIVVGGIAFQVCVSRGNNGAGYQGHVYKFDFRLEVAWISRSRFASDASDAFRLLSAQRSAAGSLHNLPFFFSTHPTAFSCSAMHTTASSHSHT